MNRWAATALLVLALAGCGGDSPPRTRGPERQARALAPDPLTEPADAMTMNGINLYMHATEPTAGKTRKPTFWLHADAFSVIDESVWAVEEARAVIYTNDPERGNIVLEAKRGRFEEGKSASLREGVRAYVGDMRIELTDIEWRNPDGESPGEARSENPVRVIDPDLRLEGSSLHLYPADKQFELTNVVGQVHFGRNPI